MHKLLAVINLFFYIWLSENNHVVIYPLADCFSLKSVANGDIQYQ